MKQNNLIQTTTGLTNHPTAVMYSLIRFKMRMAGLEGKPVLPRPSQILHDFTVVEIFHIVTTQRPGHEKLLPNVKFAN